MKEVVYERRFFWHVKLAGANGETLMVGETHYSCSNAVRAAQRIREPV
jgi:hypothetical protein